MSDIQLKNQNNQTITQAQPVNGSCVTYPSTYMPLIPNINNNNNYYVPTYQSPYYTTNYGYQMPYAYNQYPTSQIVSQNQVKQQYQPQNQTQAQTQTQPIVYQVQNGQQPQITPGATINAGGAKCEIPPGTNGLNIIINNPTVATPGSQPMINTNTNCYGGTNNGNGSGSATAKAEASAETGKNKKKNIVALTDDYIKNLENYLRSPNKELKRYAIQEIAKRFTEDETRKTNPSLNALLNLALQAKDTTVRALALSLLTSGYAGGNDITVQILNNLQQSSIHKGAEADDAKKALLKMSETVVKVPDNSPDKPQKTEGNK